MKTKVKPQVTKTDKAINNLELDVFELDILVAKDIMGLELIGERPILYADGDVIVLSGSFEHYGGRRPLRECYLDVDGLEEVVPEYSTNIEDAFAVVKRLQQLGCRVEISNLFIKGLCLWSVLFKKPLNDFEWWCCGYADHSELPLAIVQAALQAIKPLTKNKGHKKNDKTK